MPLSPLSDAAITAALVVLPGWQRQGDALVITWRFISFLDALEWMQACAPDIERLDHHPDWRNIYNRVEVRLSTHDAHNRITALDVELAKRLHQRAQEFGAKLVN